jgi:S-formylglutathione hydrolase
MADSRLELIEIPAESVKGPVPVAVLLPPGFDAAGEPLPLCLNLHGGGENSDFLGRIKPSIDALWADGSLPRMVHVMADTGPLSWYWHWDDFLIDELPAWMAQRYHTRTDPAGTAIMGISMGGFGSLNLAFKHPTRFAGLAALEPGVEPAFRYRDIAPRNAFYHFADANRERFGDPVDEAAWARESPAALARDNADAIRSTALKIYLEVGDRDVLNLHDGTEFLHRVLWELDIRHEYHLVYGADHVGVSLLPRHQEAYRFLGAALTPKPVQTTPYEPNAQERAWSDWIQNAMVGPAPQRNDILSERARGFIEYSFRERIAEATSADPTMARNYARLPEPR